MVKENVLKQTEIGLIPEDWAICRLAEVSKKVTDGTHDTPKPIEKGIPFLTAIHIKHNWIDYKNCYYLPESVHALIYSRCNPEKDDVLMVNIGAGVGNCALNIVDYEFSLKNVALIKPNISRLKGAFLNQWQNFNRENLLNNLITGGAQPFLSLSQISNIQIPLPSLPEQEAIAAALSDADAWIESLEKLITKKRLIKQGAMQQLLTPKEGWEVKKLGEVAEIAGGGTPSTFISEYWNGDIEWFTPTEVGYDKYLYSSRRKISNIGLKNSSATVLPINTILLTSRAGIGDLGILRVEASTNQGFQSIICKETVDFEFIYYLMLTKKEELLKNASGSTFLEISPNKVKSLELQIPSLTEQTRIAGILSDMDAELEALEYQLAKARQIKQGMMQKLLTGRVRLV